MFRAVLFPYVPKLFRAFLTRYSPPNSKMVIFGCFWIFRQINSMQMGKSKMYILKRNQQAFQWYQVYRDWTGFRWVIARKWCKSELKGKQVKTKILNLTMPKNFIFFCTLWCAYQDKVLSQKLKENTASWQSWYHLGKSALYMSYMTKWIIPSDPPPQKTPGVKLSRQNKPK